MTKDKIAQVAEVALTCPIEPLRDNVVIEELPATEEHVGKIVIPVTASKAEERRASKLGVVVAVGPGCIRNSSGVTTIPNVALGDVVVYLEFGSSCVHKGGTVYTITDTDGILARLVNQEPADAQ